MLKTIFDRVGAVIALVLFAVPILIIAVLVWLRMGKPVFFRQVRPGLGGKPFEMIKFRSMLVAQDGKGNPLSDAERMTRLGAFLRKSSLDELPELWNVLKGEMSLVGPRPLLMEYIPLYNAQQARRHELKPGITGWAQVNGRNAISWEEKFQMDIWYLENRTFWLDLKILWMTVKKVLFRSDISAQGEATMPKFTGTRTR